MLTPATHKSGAAVFQAREEVNHQPGNFCGRWITVMPDNVLETITQYLSMQDMDNLGRVCRKLQSSLLNCGLPIIRQYLSLPKNQQRFYLQMATGNRQLIDLIRKKKLSCGYRFPVQFSPAMCIAFTQSLRQRLISSTTISLEPRGCIEAASYDNRGFPFERRFMNKNVNRLGLDNSKQCEIAYWKADINGFWSSDHRFRYSREVVDYLRFDADLELNNCSDSGVDIRDEGKHVQVVELSLADSPARLSLNLPAESAFKLSEDGKTLLYLQPGIATIYDLERDNHWQCTGRFDTVDTLFCPGGLYIALKRADKICFLKRSRSGSWVSSGSVNYVKSKNDNYVCSDKEVVFSPEGCHVLAKCTHKRPWYRQYLAPDLFVHAAIGSIDSDGQWFTQTVIRKTIPNASNHLLPKIAFTEDGKHLIVGGKMDFDAWRLSEDGQWIESVKNCCVADSPDIVRDDIDFDMQLSREGGVMMITLLGHIIIWTVDSNGLWQRQVQELCRYPFVAQISPDGKSLACPDGSGKTVIWLRDPGDNWHRQATEIPNLCLTRFNDQSCLLAAKTLSINNDSIILLGLTPQQEWQVKCRLVVNGDIIELGFSPCGRSLLVENREGNKMKTAFWHINPDVSGDNSPT